MDKFQAQQLIKDTFRNKFDENKFARFVAQLFHNFDFNKATPWQQGQYIFQDYRENVKRFKRIGQYKEANNVIDILLVNLYKESTLHKARTKQRDYIAKY